MPHSPELLLPAGNLEKMRYAYAYGADAVYAGLPRYSLRARNNDFQLEQIRNGIDEAHGLGKKFYVTSNLMPHNAKVKTFLDDMHPIAALQPDALIMADPGLIMLVRESWPDIPIHLSVQANTVNYATVKFWQSIGLTRIILSRELSLEEIEEIRQQCPDMELEVFVHGALCIAYSGRCLLSGYFNHRDPNQGTCTNSCRWDYQVHSASENPSGDIVPVQNNYATLPPSSCGGQTRHPLSEQVYLLEEGQRPGELMPIMEDEHGTYIMNSKDLRAIEHIGRLVAIGIDSLKIEGRTKSAYYVARTTQAYRQAINDAVAGKPFDTVLLAELESLANRGYTDGFFQRHHAVEYQNYMSGQSEMNRRQYVGDVIAYDAARCMAEIEVKNRFVLGDRLEIIHPSGNRMLLLESMQDAKGNPLLEAPGSGYRVWIPLADDVERGMIAKFL